MPKLMFVENEWVRSSNDKQLNVLDPSKGQVLDTVPHGTKDDVGKAVDAARDAFDRGEWSRIPPGDRANMLLKVATMLEQNSRNSSGSKPRTLENPSMYLL